MFLRKNHDLELLKYIAILLMILDHYAFISGQFLELRILGRWSYPCFAFLLAYNARFRSSNLINYSLRLLFIGIISQPIYILYFNTYQLNILFNLCFSLLSVYFFINKKYIHSLLFTILLIFCSYNIISIFIIYGFYYIYNKEFHVKLTSFLLILTGLFFLNFSSNLALPLFTSVFPVFLCLIIYVDSLLRVKRLPKYITYYFYPIHLIILYILFIPT